MIHSMTGFGRASVRVDALAYEVEVRSVNHRHLESRVRVPRSLGAFEAELKACVAGRVGRGKVDMTISTAEGTVSTARLEVDLAVAEQYARAAASLRGLEGLEGQLGVDTLMGLPGVTRLGEPELPLDSLQAALVAGAEEALDALLAMRAVEGAAIERDLLARIERVEGLAASLASRSEVVGDAVRERLRKRTEQLRLETGLLDEARLHQEIVFAADRLDVSEEIVRLRSHVDQFREIVAAGKVGSPVGRQLDFLLQEFVREANTIGSKGSDAPIAHEVVELKTELERIREQVQNVE